MLKSDLRALVRTRKRAHSAAELAAFSAAAVARLAAHPRLLAAQRVLLYYSLPDEIDTHALADRLVAAGKTVVLPHVVGDGLMCLRRYTGPSDLRTGAFGIMEPAGADYDANAEGLDVAVVPGMAFDRSGHRLGRGKGYYDRFLAALARAPYIIGLCFPFQLVESVPVAAHDVAVDEVISGN